MSNPGQVLLIVIIFITGLCFGSFLNVIVYRLPRNLSIIRPPSRCPYCSRLLGLIELIPVLGYLSLRGRCRQCRALISPRYPLVEFCTGLLFVIVFISYAFTLEFFIYLTLLFLLFGIALIDLEHRIVPNSLVAAGLIAALIYYLPQAASYIFNLPQELVAQRSIFDAFAGLLLGGGIMLVIFLVSRGGMGAGDIKLMALIGFYVGLQGTAVVFFIGFLFGAITGIAFMLFGNLTRKDALPFAPFLSLATLIQVLYGQQIWNWYLNLLL